MLPESVVASTKASAVRPNPDVGTELSRTVALAADWATPTVKMPCFHVIPEGPNSSQPGDVLATGNRNVSPNPDGTGHVGIVIQSNARPDLYPNSANTNARLVSAATIAPPYWPAGQEFQSGTITLTDYGFRLSADSQNQGQGLIADSTVRRFECY